jgi:hypothetical protein
MSKSRFGSETEIQTETLPKVSVGRLYAAAQSGVSPDGRRILKLDMTARGIPADPSEESRQAWFDQAHIWITRGFADLSDKVIQELVWRRTG